MKKIQFDICLIKGCYDCGKKHSIIEGCLGGKKILCKIFGCKMYWWAHRYHRIDDHTAITTQGSCERCNRKGELSITLPREVTGITDQDIYITSLNAVISHQRHII